MGLVWGILVCSIIGVILAPSMATVALAELVKDWLHTVSLTLSSSEYQALLKALHYPTSTLRIGEGSAFCTLVAFVIPLVCHQFFMNISLVLAGIVWGLSIILGLAFIGKTSWTPLSAISRLSSPIPDAGSGSSQILALNIVVVVGVCIRTFIMTSIVGGMWWESRSRPAPNPRPILPQRANARNSQAGAPAEYDLENLTSSETVASPNPSDTKAEAGANLTSSEIGDSAKLSSPKTAASTNLTSQDGAG